MIDTFRPEFGRNGPREKCSDALCGVMIFVLALNMIFERYEMISFAMWFSCTIVFWRWTF